MLQVNLYPNSLSLYQLPFIEESGKTVTIICPNPTITDNIRGKIQSGYNGPIEIEVITISKFINDKLASLGIEEKIHRKSDLMLQTSIIWKGKYKDEPVENFLLAFEQFTELRSFSTNFELVREVFSNYDSKIADALQTFWLVADQLDIIDEQRAYDLVSESIRQLTGDDDLDQRSLVFLGFSHMAASQIDLLQALSIRQNIHVPFPKSAYLKTQGSDWIRWLSSDPVDCQLEEIATPDLNLINFSKGRLGEVLSSAATTCSDQNEFNIYLGKKNPDFNDFNEIPFNGLYFKAQVEIFESDIKGTLGWILDLLDAENDLLDTATLIAKLEQKRMDALSCPFETKDFKLIKVLTSFIETLQEWQGLSDLNLEFSFFDFNILKQVISLNLPRVSTIPLLDQETVGQLRGFEGLEAFDSDEKNLLIVTSAHGPLKGGESDYPEEMLEFLNAIGPMRRRELDFQLLKSKLYEFLAGKNSSLFFERGLEERDEGWAELLSLFTLEVDEPVNDSKIIDRVFDFNKLIENVAHPPMHLSASRMQSYLDCPRKYYMNYIESFSPELDLTESLRPNDLGQMQHLVIQRFMEKNNSFETNKHNQLCLEILRHWIEKNKLEIAAYKFNNYLQEIIFYSKNGITNLFKLSDHFGGEFFFEKEVKGGGVAGRIDCYFKVGSRILVIDFKRSKSSIPSGKDITEQVKIQLWFYLKFGPYEIEDISGFGYLNLADPEDSLINFLDKEFLLQVKDTGFCGAKALKHFKPDFLEKMDSFSDFYQETLEKMKTESQFSAVPLNSKVCLYCPLKNLCDKGRDCE
ncbi:MAG: hypothetical protein HN509_12520 [Halobacteriovoraceae bacterium]|jgi:hypothetical protein|nr:hypothetical protein [Halobacteriovoraceae bacterium]MBT5095052.1 hypothetical protein [Halobacteriovoraceae bacterium]